MISLIIEVVEKKRKENVWKDSIKENEKELFKEKIFGDNEKEETRIKKNGSDWYIWLIRRVKLGIGGYFTAMNLIERNWREKLHVVYQNFISWTVRQLF